MQECMSICVGACVAHVHVRPCVRASMRRAMHGAGACHAHAHIHLRACAQMQKVMSTKKCKYCRRMRAGNQV
eukprot:144914-Chlamydomonas_euryale.AAC.3